MQSSVDILGHKNGGVNGRHDDEEKLQSILRVLTRTRADIPAIPGVPYTLSLNMKDMVIANCDHIHVLLKIVSRNQMIINTLSLIYRSIIDMLDVLQSWVRSVRGLHFFFLL